MFDIKSSLFRFGAIISAMWVVIAIGFLYFFGNWTAQLKPNEWGDVFAGLAAPLAFLWLVLGFLQQGDELKLSTNALMLQAEELKNAVTHQRELVEVTRQQAMANLQQQHEEREARRIAAEPRFVLSHAGASGGPDGVRYNIRVANAGPTATNIHGAITPPAPRGDNAPFFPTIGTSEDRTFVIQFDTTPTYAITVVLAFTDALGIPGEQVFVGIFAPGNILRFERQR